MLRRLTTAVLLILISLSKIYCQDSLKINTHLLLQKLVSLKNKHFTVENDAIINIIPIENPQFEAWEKRIIKTPDETFIRLDGTGRVYKINSLQKDSILISRIDNTTYFGYNFKSINFEYKGKLYSFGGEGFWRRNGQLRVFSDIKKEWDIIPLNYEIPTINQLYFLDYPTGKLYYAARTFKDFATNKMVDLDEWYCLDLNTFTNHPLGSINEELKGLIPILKDPNNLNSYSLPEFKGIIFTDNEHNHKFIHLPTLMIYDINNDRLIQSLKPASKGYGFTKTIFAVDSTIYIMNPSTKNLDSILIKKPFYNTNAGKSIFRSSLMLTSSMKLLLLGTVVISLIAFLNFLFKKKKTNPINGSTVNQFIIFDPIEKILINLLKVNLENGVTIPEVNDLLGLSKKPLSIQKKNRNEVILNINKKYKILQDSEEDLIIRRRDEYDKRSFIYFLNQEA